MHLSPRDLSKIKYGAGSVVCGLLVTGGSVAAKYGLLGKGAMVSVLPIVGSVAGIALISFGLLMLYQVNERRNFLVSIGKAVQIPAKSHDQKKTSSSPALLSILQIGAIGIATAIGIYAVAKWVGTGSSSSSTHTGASASEPRFSFPTADTTYSTKLMSVLGTSNKKEMRLALSTQEVIPSQEYTLNLPKFDSRQPVITLLQHLMTDKNYKTNPIPTNNRLLSDLLITQLPPANTTLENLPTKNYPIVKFKPTLLQTQNNQSALDLQGSDTFILSKIVPLTGGILTLLGGSYLALRSLLTSLASLRKRSVDSLLPTYSKDSGKNDPPLDRRSPFPPSRPSGSSFPFFSGSDGLAVLPSREDLFQQYIANRPTSSVYRAPFLPVIEEDNEFFEIVIDNSGLVEIREETNEAMNPNHELIEVIVENGPVVQDAGVLIDKPPEVQNAAQELREAVVVPAHAPPSQEVSIDIQSIIQKIRHKKPPQTRQEPNPLDAVWVDIPLNDDLPVNDNPPGEISVYISDVNSEGQTALARPDAFRLDFYRIYSLAARFFSNLLPQIKQWTRYKRDLKKIEIHLI